MKKLLFILVFFVSTVSTLNAQVFNPGKKIKTELIKYVAPIGNFNQLFIDTQAKILIHDSMKEINPDHNPTLIIIKDKKKKYWRLAITLEEASRMPDDVNVASVKYNDLYRITKQLVINLYNKNK